VTLPVPALAQTGTKDTGGMLSRAETALRVAEKSYKAGAISLLELLEAQRTYLDTRAQYLRALHDFRQAAVDVTHAVGE
jgi:cobalt-zinc-cadmium efflux system outer membrane protein